VFIAWTVNLCLISSIVTTVDPKTALQPRAAHHAPRFHRLK
jgi:hypothetical protein